MYIGPIYISVNYYNILLLAVLSSLAIGGRTAWSRNAELGVLGKSHGSGRRDDGRTM